MLRKTGDDFIILEPKDGMLKVGVFTPNAGRVHVKAVRVLPLLDQPLDSLSRDLRAALRETGTKVTRAYLIIPRSSLIIRHLTIPSERPHEIREMLSLGIHQYIPYESHEVSFDFRIAENRADGFSKVLLLSALKSSIDEQMVFAEGAGLEIIDVLCSTEAAWRSVTDPDQKEDGTRLLVDIDAFSTDVIAFGQNFLKFTRAISVGLRSREEGVSTDIFIDQFVADIKLSVESFQKEFPSVVVDHVLINGSEEYTEDLTRRLERQLACKVSVADLKPLPVVWNQGTGMMGEFKEKGVSFLALLGGAFLATEPGSLSFLPAERKHERIRKHHEGQMILAGLSLAGALLCIAFFFGANIFATQATLKGIRREVDRIENEARSAEQALNKLKIISAGYENRLIVLNMLDELHRMTPEGIILTQLLLEDHASVKIRGLAKRNVLVSEYLSAIEQSRLFVNTEHMGSQRKLVERNEFFEFTIAAQLARKTL